jgi:hypothetical protein
MTTTVARVLCLSLLIIAWGSCLAQGHSHQGGQQDQKQKKDQPPEQNAATESFDPNAVNQVVTTTAAGGIRRVVANESSDAKQIGLIRANLKALADKFGPAALAGPAGGRSPGTPALTALQSAASGQLRAQYLEVRAGAEVRYSSDDPALAAALREWLDAQRADQATGTPMAHDHAVGGAQTRGELSLIPPHGPT